MIVPFKLLIVHRVKRSVCLNILKIIWIILKKTIVFYWKNDFIEKIILLNEQFYWTNDSTKQLLSEKNERNRWKMNDNFENKRNIIFERMKKKTNKMGRSQTKWKKPKASITTYLCPCLSKPLLSALMNTQGYSSTISRVLIDKDILIDMKIVI